MTLLAKRFIVLFREVNLFALAIMIFLFFSIFQFAFRVLFDAFQTKSGLIGLYRKAHGALIVSDVSVLDGSGIHRMV